MIQVKECIQILSSLAVYNPLVSCSQNVLQYSCRRSCINNRVFLYTLRGALRSLHREQSVNCCETETRWSEWPVMVVVGGDKIAGRIRYSNARLANLDMLVRGCYNNDYVPLTRPVATILLTLDRPAISGWRNSAPPRVWQVKWEEGCW